MLNGQKPPPTNATTAVSLPPFTFFHLHNPSHTTSILQALPTLGPLPSTLRLRRTPNTTRRSTLSDIRLDATRGFLDRPDAEEVVETAESGEDGDEDCVLSAKWGG